MVTHDRLEKEGAKRRKFRNFIEPVGNMYKMEVSGYSSLA